MTYALVDLIKRSGYPTTSKAYRKAHKEANRQEKQRFGVGAFKAINRIALKLPKGELLGSHTNGGKIKVSSKVPRKYRKEIEYHERIEHRAMNKKKCKK